MEGAGWMVRTTGFGITDLADEKSQFATSNYVTMDKWLNCYKSGFSVSQSYKDTYVISWKAVTLSFMFTPVFYSATKSSV